MEQCRVCRSTDLGEVVSLSEMMFKTGEAFDYRQCRACECLQIVDHPGDMARHYHTGYYSFSDVKPSFKSRARDSIAMNGPAFLFSRFDWFNQGGLRSVAKLDRGASILDIGCGGGDLLRRMHWHGFTSLTGVDPFIETDLQIAPGLKIRKAELDQIEGPFDVVMMHHSLEHMWDQDEALGHVSRLLAPGGRAIIRIPTVDSWAYETFGTNWAQLDPPRHFYLHSRKSIRIAMERAGLAIREIVDDGTVFGVAGSVKASLGRSIIDPDPVPLGAHAQTVKRLSEVNRSGRGDQIAVHGVRVG